MNCSLLRLRAAGTAHPCWLLPPTKTRLCSQLPVPRGCQFGWDFLCSRMQKCILLQIYPAQPWGPEGWQSQPQLSFTVKVKSWAYLPDAKRNRAAENTGILGGQPDLDLKRPMNSLPPSPAGSFHPPNQIGWQLPMVLCQSRSRRLYQAGEPHGPCLPPVTSLPPGASTLVPVRGSGTRDAEDKRSHQSPGFFIFTLAFDEHRMTNSLPCRFSDTQTLNKIYTDAAMHNKDHVSAFPVLGEVRGRRVCLC